MLISRVSGDGALQTNIHQIKIRTMISAVPLFSYDSDSSSNTCPVCQGKGVVNVTVIKECSVCGGTGMVQGLTCQACLGVSTIYEIEEERVCSACFGQACI